MKQLTRKTAIELLRCRPYKLGHAAGFTKLKKLHNKWITEMVFGKEDKTLQAHRGSYKTTCVSIAIAVIMILYPNQHIMFMRKTDSDCREVILQVKKLLEHPTTKAIAYTIWGVELKLLRFNTVEITTNLTNDLRGTPQLVGIGINSSLTGKHFDRIFTDDIVNIKDRVSSAEREHTRLMYQELRNIINRGGRIYNSGTPWHKDDCFELMPNPEKWDCYSTGLISEKELEEIHSHMLNSLFAANYELKHIAAEDLIFVNPIRGAEPSLAEQAKVSHIDAAYTDGGDYTAFTIVNKKDGKYYVFGKLWHKSVDKVQGEIIGYRKRFNARKIWCELNADKGLLAKELRKQGETVVTYHEDENKFIKIVTYLKWAWDKVIFVTGTDESYIQQICDFNENAEHDDAPDSLASTLRLLWDRRDKTL